MWARVVQHALYITLYQIFVGTSAKNLLQFEAASRDPLPRLPLLRCARKAGAGEGKQFVCPIHRRYLHKNCGLMCVGT